MSQPSHKRHPYDAIQETELARWPGVTWDRQHRSKHFALVLTFGSVSRFVIYPTSPGDGARGGLNHITDVRKVCRELGAQRLAETRAAHPHRHRTRVEVIPPIRLSAQAGTRLGRDPFAALAVLQVKAPAAATYSEPVPAKPLTFWRRVKARLVSFRRHLSTALLRSKA